MATRILAPEGANTHPQDAGHAPSIVFQSTGWKHHRYSSGGTVPASGCLLNVHASARLDEIDVSIQREGINCGFRVSADDARALAAELIAAADSVTVEVAA